MGSCCPSQPQVMPSCVHLFFPTAPHRARSAGSGATGDEWRDTPTPHPCPEAEQHPQPCPGAKFLSEGKVQSSAQLQCWAHPHSCTHHGANLGTLHVAVGLKQWGQRAAQDPEAPEQTEPRRRGSTHLLHCGSTGRGSARRCPAPRSSPGRRAGRCAARPRCRGVGWGPGSPLELGALHQAEG